MVSVLEFTFWAQLHWLHIRFFLDLYFFVLGIRRLLHWELKLLLLLLHLVLRFLLVLRLPSLILKFALICLLHIMLLYCWAGWAGIDWVLHSAHLFLFQIGFYAFLVLAAVF